MRVLIIADEGFALRERAMLSRLEVGLADEGVRVVHGLPAGTAAPTEVFSQSITYEPGTGLGLRWRAQRFARSLEALADPNAPGRPVDLIHVFGERAWGIAAETAALTGAGLVVELWRAALVPEAARLRAGGEQGSGGIVALAPDPAIARLMQEHDPGGAMPVRIAPWGVHTPPAPVEVLRPGRVASAVLIGSGRNPAALAAAVEGLAGAMARVPDLMAFAESQVVETARLWPLIKRLGITDRFTLAPDLESRRELALRADLLLFPESLGEHRSITLDAMAAGMLVVAAADPAVGVLIDQTTAILVPTPRPDPWRDALAQPFADPEAARKLALSAREHIRQHRRASTHVSAVVDAYEWMLAGESIPFQRTP